MTVALVVVISSLAVLVWCVRAAPEGWQDQDGFHVGPQGGED